MKMLTLLVATVLTASAYAQETPVPDKKASEIDPRLVIRSADAEWFNLYCDDPELAEAMAILGIAWPLPPGTDIKDARKRIVEAYRKMPKNQPLPKVGYRPEDLEIEVGPPLPEGHMGTVVRVWKRGAKQEEAQKLLQAEPAPAQRTEFYKDFLKGKRFLGWKLDLLESQTVDGMTTVQVLARPFAELEDGTYLDVMGVTKETYELKNGKLKLLKVEVPKQKPFYMY